MDELGGGPLRILSARDVATHPLGTPAVPVLTSTTGAQLLFAVEGGQARGLAITVPGDAGPIRLDAESTAAALVFISPGVSTIDPVQARTQLGRIRACPEFAPLVQSVRGALRRAPLSAAVQSPGIQELLARLLETLPLGQDRRAARTTLTPHTDVWGAMAEWLRPASACAAPAQTVVAEPDKWRGECHVTPDSAQPPDLSAVGLRVENRGYRYVEIHRREYSATGALVRKMSPKTLDVLAGAPGLSIGSLVTRTPFAATTRPEVVDFGRPENCTMVEYWIGGPGLQFLGDNPPPDIDPLALPSEAWAATLVIYALVPAVNIVVGADVGPQTFSEGSWEQIGALWNADKLVALDGPRLGKAVADGDDRAMARTSLNALTSALGALAKEPSLADSLLGRAAVAARPLNQVLSLANLFPLLAEYAALPEWVCFRVRLEPGLAPAQSSDVSAAGTPPLASPPSSRGPSLGSALAGGTAPGIPGVRCETVSVTVDYGLAVEKVAELGEYTVGSDYRNITSRNFPVSESEEALGKRQVEVALFSFRENLGSSCGGVLPTEHILAEFSRLGYRPATLRELLALGAQHPDLQETRSIVALGSTWKDPEITWECLAGDRQAPELWYQPGCGRLLALHACEGNCWDVTGLFSSYWVAAVRR